MAQLAPQLHEDAVLYPVRDDEPCNQHLYNCSIFYLSKRAYRLFVCLLKGHLVATNDGKHFIRFSDESTDVFRCSSHDPERTLHGGGNKRNASAIATTKGLVVSSDTWPDMNKWIRLWNKWTRIYDQVTPIDCSVINFSFWGLKQKKLQWPLTRYHECTSGPIFH